MEQSALHHLVVISDLTQPANASGLMRDATLVWIIPDMTSGQWSGAL